METDIMVRHIGHQGEPLVIIDGFSADPDALRTAAINGAFEPAGNHYPGIRSPLPDGYLRRQFPTIARALGHDFGPFRQIRVLDASFSMVTQSPETLHVRQRIPHVDAYGRERIALIHYLSPDNHDGTAFFRHRATGFETIDQERAPTFFSALDAELQADVPDGYISGDSSLFECTDMVEAQYNRALLYRSHLLHSGAIRMDGGLSPEPEHGRLTITAFLEIS
ncbi:hypothetical protein QE361_003605 [Sphingomonas sp. SORGH_AS802]|uniref:DUF6445 family protein n=2 Tax=unclassified Sphingomonas TaxID=196159 RepID=UPI00285852A3|nr:DUF6445 family protein [Sphingomonas sp. SORGH_AS_0802]MDR6126097.1 hypothetical protein [Sphingomonas sp. SORGH_AS_0438]MDR6136597.1 hypothetical protein [Sphingomonas sp. SORGH_AS_0802]